MSPRSLNWNYFKSTKSSATLVTQTNSHRTKKKGTEILIMVLLKGWKYVAMVGSVVGVIGLAIYPIIVSPMVNPEPYSKLTTFTVMQ